MSDQNKLGIALGGGGALGMAHIGAIKAFEEFEIEPSIISGTSSGSLIGALYSYGININKIEEIATSIDRMKTISLFSPTIQKGGLINDENLLNFLQEHVGDTRIEDLETEFISVSVDINTGDIIYFDRGNLVAAIRASIAIPGIFLPYQSNGKLYVDGGLRSNLPLKVIKKYDPKFTMGVNVLKNSNIKMDSNFSGIELNSNQEDNNINLFHKITNYIKSNKKDKSQFPHILRSLFNSLQILLAENSKNEIEIVNPDIVIEIDVSEYNLWEFWKAEEIIKIGYKNTINQLKNSDFIKKLKESKN